MRWCPQPPRFVAHGRRGTFVKYGLDPQEDVLKSGRRPPAGDWGVDAVPAMISVWQDAVFQQREMVCLPGAYPAYYTAVRDAVLGRGANPVDAAAAIRVISLLELGLQSNIRNGSLTSCPSNSIELCDPIRGAQ